MVKLVSQTGGDEVKEAPSTGTPRRAGLVSQTDDIQGLIKKAAETYNLDPLLLWAQIKRESGFNPRIQGPETSTGERASGLMQLMPKTARMLGVTDPFDPEQNIMGGAKYMRQLLDREDVKGDYTKALRYYIGGFDPKKWGSHTAAYPNLVFGEYRQAGGRKNDPLVPEVDRLTIAADAYVPGVSIPEMVIRAVKGRGPDLSQGLSGPEANRPVGAKLRDWWNTPGQADLAVNRLRKGIANRKDEFPIETAAMQLGSSLPLTLALGGAMNKGVEAIAPSVRSGINMLTELSPAAGKVANALIPSAEFLTGKAGYGLPGTAEGASALTRWGSNIAQGALQGAVSAGANARLTPEVDFGTQIGTGALFGGGLSAIGNPLAEAGGQLMFGKKIPMKAAELGQDLINGTSGPKMDLKPILGHPNQLGLDPQAFSRQAFNIIDEPIPVGGMVPGTTQPRMGQTLARLGGNIDKAAEKGFLAADGELLNHIDDLMTIGREKGVSIKPLQDLYTRIRNESASGAGLMPGKEYLELTQKGSLIHRWGNSSDPVRQGLAKDLRAALDASLERGTEANWNLAVSSGNPELAARAQEVLLAVSKARNQYNSGKVLEDVASKVTGEFQPAELAAAVKGHNASYGRGDLGQMGRMALAGEAFDPALKRQAKGWTLSNSGLATLMGLGIGAPVTSGMAALSAAAAALTGLGVRKGVGALPGYPGMLLERSLRQGQGPLQAGLNRTTVPLAGAGGNFLIGPKEAGEQDLLPLRR